MNKSFQITYEYNGRQGTDTIRTFSEDNAIETFYHTKTYPWMYRVLDVQIVPHIDTNPVFI